MLKLRVPIYVALIAAVSVTDTRAADIATAPSENVSSAVVTLGEKADNWLDNMGNSFRQWVNKVPELSEEAKKYSEELKNRWPEVRKQFEEKLRDGLDKGKEAGESLKEWTEKTFTKERIDSAEKWLTDFKNGTEEKVVDPLVPYLLSLRYPNPIDEWNAGYRRNFPVLINKDANPVEVSLPLSWELVQNTAPTKERLITWRSDSGAGSLVVSLNATAPGSTVESLMAGLEKKLGNGERAVKLPDSEIRRLYFPADAARTNAVYYYAVPLNDSVVLLSAEVLGTGKNTADVNETLLERQEFFDLVAKSLYQRQ